jgi:hypothetical protein
VVPSRMLQMEKAEAKPAALANLRHHSLVGSVQAVEPIARAHVDRPRAPARWLSKDAHLTLRSLFDCDEPDHLAELFRSHEPSIADQIGQR